MKKKFLVLILSLAAMLSLASAALADNEYVTESPTCGNPNIEWYPVILGGTGEYAHHQFCRECYALVGGYELCTPLKGTGTCVTTEYCYICHNFLWSTNTYNPDRHYGLTSWNYYTDELHYRYCPYCVAESSF